MKIQQLGPGMIQQIQTYCSECRGQGERISEKNRCKTCNGKKTVRERKILEVHIDKGMMDNQKITFTGEGDQEPGLEPGDIIIVLEEKEHPLYKRSGNDLILRMNIDLVEALCGFQKVIKILDDRDLVITVIPGDVIKPGDVKCVVGEGMPHYKNPFEKGRLIIQFMVDFPKSLPPEKIPTLESCLPARSESIIPENAEECTLLEMDPESDNRRRGGSHHGNVYDEDEPGSGASRVQCATH